MPAKGVAGIGIDVLADHGRTEREPEYEGRFAKWRLHELSPDQVIGKGNSA
jgi:hypothetical protein